MERSETYKPKVMRNILKNLGPDEGVSIVESGGRRKVFINKNPTGFYTLQLVYTRSRKHNHDEEFNYVNSVEDVISVVKSFLTSGASYFIY